MRHRVQVSIQESMFAYYVLFLDPATQQRIGPIRRFGSDEMITDMLRRAHADLETINIVEHSLRTSRSVMVDLHLTTEQLFKLRNPKD